MTAIEQTENIIYLPVIADYPQTEPPPPKNTFLCRNCSTEADENFRQCQTCGLELFPF